MKRLKKHLRANPGTLFIGAFQVLLVSAAVLFLEGNSGPANQMSIYAFCALVIGVAIQIGVLVMEERNYSRAGIANYSKPS